MEKRVLSEKNTKWQSKVTEQEIKLLFTTFKKTTEMYIKSLFNIQIINQNINSISTSLYSFS